MKKAATVPLPKGVFRVRRKARTYYYFQFGRGSRAPGKRHALPGDPQSPEFWQAVKRLTGEGEAQARAGSFAALIAAYRTPGNPDWSRLAANTRKDYGLYLDRIAGLWGALPVAALSPADVLALRDSMSATPVAANHMLSILRTLLAWGVPRGWRSDNPAREIARFKGSEPNAPWPVALYQAALAHAKAIGATDIYRALFLLRETGQRQSDALRFRPADRAGPGFRFTIQKTGRAHFAPLSAAAVSEIDAWSGEKMVPYAVASTGRPHTQPTFGARWHRFLSREDSANIRAEMERLDLSVHGLRALKCCDLRCEGMTHQEIALIVGMSTAMVERYTRKIDQEIAAGHAQERLEDLQRSRSFGKGSRKVLENVFQLGADKTKT